MQSQTLTRFQDGRMYLYNQTGASMNAINQEVLSAFKIQFQEETTYRIDVSVPDPPLSVLVNQVQREENANCMQALQKRVFVKVGLLPENVATESPEIQNAMIEEAVSKIQADESKYRPLLKETFVDLLYERDKDYRCFENCSGTIFPMETYPVNDPVLLWYRENRSEDLALKELNVEADCEYLQSAMKGIGTDEDKIIGLLCNRSNSQRQLLREKYKSMYGQGLLDDFKDELGGDFYKCVEAMMYSPAEYDAITIKEAVYGLGTDERALIETLFGRTQSQLEALRTAYGQVVSPHRQTLETKLDEDIAADTSGDFKKVLVAAAQANRDQISRDQIAAALEEIIVNGKFTGLYQANYDKLVDMEKCKAEARRLYEAGEAKWCSTDEETFTMLFSTRNTYELQAIWKEYVKLSQSDIINAIWEEFSGDYRRALLAIVLITRSPPTYFAHRLKESMEAAGTDEKTLIRIIVSRSEVDLAQIKKVFFTIRHKSLYAALEDETSGDFKNLLLAIVKPD